MKPEQFIREYGVEKAREVVAACPEYYHFYHIVEGAYYTCPKASRVAVKDLKRLVESLDLIKTYGGIEACKQSLYMLHELTEDPEPIREAVRDYESIYGGGDE
ncbi:hypothetical protein [Acinetobacter baumannii]|uniref:Uncharacterized protein n=1 Tax=Acinetobacter baumannii 1499986 TaxID=1310673 RepID=A0A836YLE9_ACIBA|nr:hypothetical protein [Acinetobacter baumannii]EXC36229.1 hypothetical protein J552_3853 [Acinetobacter baumannii 951631]EXG10596.1 hypothetical protein J712_2406 [Acinetobacter baumannii 722310]EXI01448.1 hypothetical protein J618_1454 [Acinetobacter baumannii 607805]EXI04902.1 hypothetical protein J639_1594 [Acinetobacter baumannii 457946]EXQ92616.1 hypothetical protein J681_1535 [Acinetobacter baumannii 1170863]